MEAILVNYNFTPEWLSDCTHFGLVTIYDRSDDGIERNLERFGKVIKTANQGQVDLDKLSYLIDHYDTLPDVFLWGKTNLFKYISEEEYNKVKDNQFFTPLLTQNHKQKIDGLGVLCYYEGGMYYERNTMLFGMQTKFCKTYNEFAYMFGLPTPEFIPFPPGGNFILTREVVHKYSRDFYKDMRNVLDYCKEPAEAQFCERAYYTMWK